MYRCFWGREWTTDPMNHSHCFGLFQVFPLIVRAAIQLTNVSYWSLASLGGKSPRFHSNSGFSEQWIMGSVVLHQDKAVCLSPDIWFIRTTKPDHVLPAAMLTLQASGGSGVRSEVRGQCVQMFRARSRRCWCCSLYRCSPPSDSERNLSRHNHSHLRDSTTQFSKEIGSGYLGSLRHSSNPNPKN